MNVHGALVAVGAGAVLGLLAAPAAAATWVAPRTTPALSQILTVDATGETLWPYGAEDVAGDGLATFNEPEQSIDIRTAYVATDATRFWVRVYVSSMTAVSATDTVFVFIDTDNNAATGGSANAPALNAKFTTDPTGGGYEDVIGIRGNGTVSQIWQWNNPQKAFVGAPPAPAMATAETGLDVDPIQLLSFFPHAYLQASVDLTLLGLAPACDAKIFVRSADDSGIADLDVGTAQACVAVDNNGDGFPDVVPIPAACTADNQCPGGGLCVNGQCVVPAPCVTDADCKATEQCLNDKCVPKPGGTCTTNADCQGLVCMNGTCSACTQGAGDLCGPGFRCGPRGQCVAAPVTPVPDAGTDGGLMINPGDVVQGGACACALGPTHERDDALGVLFGIALGAVLRGRRSRRNARRGS